MQQYLRKYGVQTILNFVLYEVDGVDLRIDAADAGADCTLRKDQGADTTNVNDFVDEGIGYSITLTGTEMEFAEGLVHIIDSATKQWLDETLKIETYGNASAQHAQDFDTTVPTTVEIQAEMEANGASILDAIQDLLPGSTIAAATDIPAMVGTNNAALATVVGALADGAADGDPTTGETLMQYIKQLINIMVGTAGVVAFPAEAAPGNGVSLAEVIRAIHADVTGLNGSAMIGTNSAALATVCTEARLVQLAEANLPTDIAAIPTVMVGTNNAATETKQDIMDTNIDQIETAVITNAAGTDIAADIIALKAVADAIQAITDALPNSGALTIDSVAFDAAMTQILSYVSGKIVKTSDAYEYKKRDNTTKAFTNTAAAAQRTRS